MATHSSILARRIPWTEKPGGLQSMGSQRVGQDWVTSLSFSLSPLICLKNLTLWPYQSKEISTLNIVFKGLSLTLDLNEQVCWRMSWISNLTSCTFLITKLKWPIMTLLCFSGQFSPPLSNYLFKPHSPQTSIHLTFALNLSNKLY